MGERVPAARTYNPFAAHLRDWIRDHGGHEVVFDMLEAALAASATGPLDVERLLAEERLSISRAALSIAQTVGDKATARVLSKMVERHWLASQSSGTTGRSFFESTGTAAEVEDVIRVAKAQESSGATEDESP